MSVMKETIVLPVTPVASERSFSALKLTKTCSLSTKRYVSSLTMPSVESVRAKSINLDVLCGQL